jgi:hypothetical protein
MRRVTCTTHQRVGGAYIGKDDDEDGRRKRTAFGSSPSRSPSRESLLLVVASLLACLSARSRLLVRPVVSSLIPARARWGAGFVLPDSAAVVLLPMMMTSRQM